MKWGIIFFEKFRNFTFAPATPFFRNSLYWAPEIEFCISALEGRRDLSLGSNDAENVCLYIACIRWLSRTFHFRDISKKLCDTLSRIKRAPSKFISPLLKVVETCLWAQTTQKVHVYIRLYKVTKL